MVIPEEASVNAAAIRRSPLVRPAEKPDPVEHH
jgi:hypothetical protein